MTDIQKFLGALYNGLNANCVEVRGEIETLEEFHEEIAQGEDLSISARAKLIILDDVISLKQDNLAYIEAAKDALEDIIGNLASAKVERLVVRYFNTIKERFELVAPENRVSARILEREIEDIEDELEKEGFPIFGGYSTYEAMMAEEDEEEQINFNFDFPGK